MHFYPFRNLHIFSSITLYWHLKYKQHNTSRVVKAPVPHCFNMTATWQAFTDYTETVNFVRQRVCYKSQLYFSHLLYIQTIATFRELHFYTYLCNAFIKVPMLWPVLFKRQFFVPCLNSKLVIFFCVLPKLSSVESRVLWEPSPNKWETLHLVIYVKISD
jgi:hypothetical protein